MGVVRTGPWWYRALLAVLGLAAVLMAVALRLHHSLSVDEPFMANSVRLGWSALFEVFKGDNIPLPYVVLKGWTALFGETEWALRAPFVLAYAGAVVATGAAGARVGGPAAGLMAATLVATSRRIGLLHAAAARPYAWLALFAAIAMWQSLALLEEDESCRPRRWSLPAALLVTHLLGLFTHPTYAFVLAAYAAASALVERRLRSRSVLAAGAASVLYAVVWGAVVAATMRINPTDWMTAPRISDLKSAVLWMWGTGPAFLLAGALGALILTSRSRTVAAFSPRSIRWSAVACGLAWGLPFAASYAKPIFLAARTPVMLLPITALLLAGLLASLASRAVLAAVASILFLAAVTDLPGASAADNVPTRASVGAVLNRLGPSDTIVATQLAFDPVVYYLRRLNARTDLRPVAFPVALGDWAGRSGPPDNESSLRKKGSELARTLAVTGGRVWVFGRTRGIAADATAALLEEMRGRFVCDAPLPLRGAGFDAVWACSPARPAAAVPRS
jgi:mannosyltransferase